ncbi:hypothetical protein [Asticcacaulis sp. EMRT-3]|uniref:hypothetical protein n=1 Tax=Asticcacaulis sp. EMRT-3 TaxID=3040349 RepID=UPI0024AEBA03|nr:hypothetical protein [Asticcacaulis sp. EMRT-3]MDI7774139.1 hypothetical protein [Asticcacaulis sp. EMRT-3]
MSILRLIPAVAAVACLLAAPVALAQDDGSPDTGASPEDSASNEDVMTAAIGCVATYDLILTRGLAGTHTVQVQKQRDQAREIYKEAAGLDDADTDADIAQADSRLPGLLENGHADLQKYRVTCDELLSDDPDLPQASGT